MDTNVAGLNKVYCYTDTSSYNGKTVTITDGINTWSQVLESNHCTFMIPSMPAPAKRTYTVRLHNGDATASTIKSYGLELGFGDSIRLGLYEDADDANKGYVKNYLKNSSAYATASNAGTVKVGTRMEINNGVLNPNNITYGTSSKSSGSSLATGTIYCQYS